MSVQTRQAYEKRAVDACDYLGGAAALAPAGRIAPFSGDRNGGVERLSNGLDEGNGVWQGKRKGYW